jgi:hypothetical protein
MARITLGLIAAALAAGLLCGLARPAAAERTYAREDVVRSPPRIVIHPRHRYLPPTAKRHCVSWLAKEYRPSGTVITPQMRCWWR